MQLESFLEESARNQPGKTALICGQQRITYAELEGYDLTPDLGSLTQRVLILRGADDPFGDAMIEATREALTNADVKLVELPDCGHFWQECPHEFFKQVRAYLQLSE